MGVEIFPTISALPECVYLFGLRKSDLNRLIGILKDEKARLEARRSNACNIQLMVDLTEDIRDLQEHIDVLVNIRQGPSIFDRRLS